MKEEKNNNNQCGNDVWINEATGERISEREVFSWISRFAGCLGCGIAIVAMLLTLAGAFVAPRIERAVSKQAIAKRLQTTGQGTSWKERQQRTQEEFSVASDIQPKRTVDTPPPPADLEEVSRVIKSSDSSSKSLSERFHDQELLDYVYYPEVKIRTSGSENAVSANHSRIVFDPDVEYYITFDYREELAEDEKFHGELQVEYPTFIPEGQIGVVQIVAYDYENERYSLGEIGVYAKDSGLRLQHSAGVTSYYWSDFVETYDENGNFGFSLYASNGQLDPIAGGRERNTISSVGGEVTYEISGDDSGKLVSAEIVYYDTVASVIGLDDVRTVSELRNSRPSNLTPAEWTHITNDHASKLDYEPSMTPKAAEEEQRELSPVDPEPPTPKNVDGSSPQKPVADRESEAGSSADPYRYMGPDQPE